MGTMFVFDNFDLYNGLFNIYVHHFYCSAPSIIMFVTRTERNVKHQILNEFPGILMPQKVMVAVVHQGPCLLPGLDFSFFRRHTESGLGIEEDQHHCGLL